jgi:exodeoxyribonuclease VII large subunit
MEVTRHDDFCASIDRLSGRLAAAMRARVHRLESRLRVLEARPGYAGLPGRLAMRAQRTSELAHALRRSIEAVVASGARTCQTHERALASFDPRRRLAAARTRLVAGRGRLDAAIARRHHADEARLRGAAGRLDALSPLAVLGRGYAVCWDAGRTRIIRDAATVQNGEAVRVEVERGALECRVTGRSERP